MNPQQPRERNADSFRADLHPDLKADFILATATRALLLPRPLSGQVALSTAELSA